MAVMRLITAVVMAMVAALMTPVANAAPQFVTFKDGKIGVNFGGYHAEAGLGGLLTGNAAHGGLSASAGTPYGQNAAAGLNGNIDGRASGVGYAGAQANPSVGASAILGGAAGHHGYIGSEAHANGRVASKTLTSGGSNRAAAAAAGGVATRGGFSVTDGPESYAQDDQNVIQKIKPPKKYSLFRDYDDELPVAASSKRVITTTTTKKTRARATPTQTSVDQSPDGVTTVRMNARDRQREIVRQYQAAMAAQYRNQLRREREQQQHQQLRKRSRIAAAAAYGGSGSGSGNVNGYGGGAGDGVGVSVDGDRHEKVGREVEKPVKQPENEKREQHQQQQQQQQQQQPEQEQEPQQTQPQQAPLPPPESHVIHTKAITKTYHKEFIRTPLMAPIPPPVVPPPGAVGAAAGAEAGAEAGAAAGAAVAGGGGIFGVGYPMAMVPVKPGGIAEKAAAAEATGSQLLHNIFNIPIGILSSLQQSLSRLPPHGAAAVHFSKSF